MNVVPVWLAQVALLQQRARSLPVSLVVLLQSAQHIQGGLQGLRLYSETGLLVAGRVAGGFQLLAALQRFLQLPLQALHPLAGFRRRVLGGTQLLAACRQGLLQASGLLAELPLAVRQTGDARLEVRDLSFSYSPDMPVLEGLTLSIERGQRVAIVGSRRAIPTTRPARCRTCCVSAAPPPIAPCATWPTPSSVWA